MAALNTVNIKNILTKNGIECSLVYFIFSFFSFKSSKSLFICSTPSLIGSKFLDSVLSLSNILKIKDLAI